MYPQSIHASSIISLGLLASTSLCMPDLRPRDDLKCDDGFTFTKDCKVTGQALNRGPDGYDIKVDVYGAKTPDGKWPVLVDTKQKKITNDNWKNKDFNLPFEPIKDARLGFEMAATYFPDKGGDAGRFHFKYGSGATLDRDATFQTQSDKVVDENLFEGENYYATDAHFDCCAKLPK
ncbi:MAG: hypothetical protein L6R40_007568 [Gallowayella cf. fulva]|nr:MAG: hypothetical protein L6R40_007568 [Xanthomendoza cf. fulva]